MKPYTLSTRLRIYLLYPLQGGEKILHQKKGGEYELSKRKCPVYNSKLMVKIQIGEILE